MEQPPPYPDSSSRIQDYGHEVLEYLLNPDQETCPHPHELLVSSIPEIDKQLPSTMLHHWDSIHASSSTSLSLRTRVKPEDLRLIHGFRDLGTYQLSITDVSSPARLHRYLTSLLPKGDDGHSLASSDTEIISSMISHLGSTSGSSPPTTSAAVQFFAVPALSNAQETLFKGGPAVVWKWTKPENTYGQNKSGFWKPDLDEVVKDGETHVGRGFRLMVQGVSEEKREEFRRRMVIFPASG